MIVKLKILDGSTLRFAKDVHLPCIIGRSRNCNVSIIHPLISRQHCEIYEDHGMVMVRDLGSLNGTYYKDAPIRRGTQIPYGEGFMISCLHFVIEEADSETVKKSVNLDDLDIDAAVDEGTGDISDIFK